MECLAANKDKEEMTPKCKSYVHHFELVSLRDYHFSYRFKEACKTDIDTHCASFGQDKWVTLRQSILN
jgi:Golgi apparatus protein 1